MTKRMSAVEAAQARLEAAKKRERVGLLKKARNLLEPAGALVEAAGDVKVGYMGDEESAYGLLALVFSAIREEVGE